MVDARRRVVFAAHAYPRFAGDPVGSFVHTLAVALRDEGIDVDVVAPSAPGYPARDVLDGIPVQRFRYAPRRFETLAYTGTMGAQANGSLRGPVVLASLVASAAAAIGRACRRHDARLVHAHWWVPAGLAARAVQPLSRVPYVVTLHGSDVRLASASAPGRALFRAVVGRSAGVTAVSSWLARGARDLAPGLDVTVSPMPVRTGLFHAGDGRESHRLLFVGKLAPQKGLHRLLRAMALMRTPAPLTVVGAGRVLDAPVRALADSLGLAHRVEWLPILSQADLAAQYRRCALHVIPALDEGLGLTAVESSLSETPVVAFDSGGVPDVVLHDVTGLLVPPGDQPALAHALDALLGDVSRRVEMGRAGRAHARAAFGPDAVARRYAALYRAAIRGAGMPT